MFFDEIAAEWDTKRRIERAKVLAGAIKDSLGKAKGLIALEVGCGTGLLSFELTDVFDEIYCIDSSNEMLTVINQKIIRACIKNIFVYTTEILFQHKYYEKFDVIYSSMVFHHIIDIKKELSALHKLLKKDGTLIIIDLDKEDGRFHKEEKSFCGHNGLDRLELQEIFINSGFQDVSFQTVYAGEKQVDNEMVKYTLFLCRAS